MIEILVYGQTIVVPESLTVLKALEWAGFRLTRGVGCRAGFCGACGTVFRLPGEARIYYALACQTVVQPGMSLGQLPFFPGRRPPHRLSELHPSADALTRVFPEIEACLGCNTCTKSCPQGIDVMTCMAEAVRGDLSRVADLSFDCIQCGLCVARCPAELAPPAVTLLARRMYAKYLAAPAGHLRERLAEIECGRCDEAVRELKELPLADLEARYEARAIEE
jgi:succinate dehydrogenase/fumarate reductase-like Fe-S protein